MSDSLLQKFDNTFRPGPELYLIDTNYTVFIEKFQIHIHYFLNVFNYILQSSGKIHFINNIFVNFIILFCLFESVFFL